jgi:hypothetical protein
MNLPLASVLLRLRSDKSSISSSGDSAAPVVNELQQVEDFLSPRMLAFNLVNKVDPMQAVFVQFSAPLRNFTETMTYIARICFKGSIGQIRTMDGLKPREVANVKEDGTINFFQPFPRNYTAFVALPYQLANPLYQQYGVHNFFVDIAQSDKFSALYHRCNVVFAPRDYKDELLRGAGILPYFQVADKEFNVLKAGKRIRLLSSMFQIVDSFVDINDKTIFVIERIPFSSSTSVERSVHQPATVYS